MTSNCAVYDDGVLRITNTGDPPGLVIAGEIDESTYPGLMAALDRFADGPVEIHFSLGEVSYCDLAGLRAIVCLTGDTGNGANCNGGGRTRRVMLHGVPPQLATVLRIVGWDSTPGLAVDQPDPGVPPPSSPSPGSQGPGQGSGSGRGRLGRGSGPGGLSGIGHRA